MTESPWLRLDFELAVEPALEVRAEPDGRGGWHIRSERATGSTGRCSWAGWRRISRTRCA